VPCLGTSSLKHPPLPSDCNSAINRAVAKFFLRGLSALNGAAPSSPSALVRACQHQDNVFSSALSILDDAIAQHAFPAASVAVTYRGNLVALKAFGHFTYEPTSTGPTSFSRTVREGGALVVSPATLFDLASVSKVIATTTMAMILYERGLLDLEAPVAAIVPEFTSASPEKIQDARRREVTLRMLLAHSSGLPAYEKLFLKARTRDELLHAAFATPLAANPGSRAEYSDIGFIILGTALERIASESLDLFCQREVFGTLGMSSTTFNPPPEMRGNIPPTVNDQAFRHRIVQGEVHDENASVLGGIAGHAGVFSTAEDVAKFAHVMLNGGHPILHPGTVSLFTRREDKPEGTSRALGWDTPSRPSQSGKYFSAASFGHLGYTGTSLWIDPERGLSVTLLTNRTWPDNASQAIKTVRPRFHDAMIEALKNSV
jgi:CubicO group peptidase (beta-lactamase class C family)